MKVKKISLVKKPNHINKYLTHWTGRNKNDDTAFSILCKIIETKELKFSVNTTSFPGSNDIMKGTMICFTDTPIKQSLYHCERYNYFGISFNKEEMIEHGANPVLYIVDNRKEHFERMKKHFSDDKNDLLMLWYGSVSQPYNPKEIKDASYFYEREWRITRKLREDIPYSSTGTHNTYKYKEKIRHVPKKDSEHDEEFYLPFNPAIIENIIVPTDYVERAKEMLIKNELTCQVLELIKP